jgi:DivIVA domain-containing protein
VTAPTTGETPATNGRARRLSPDEVRRHVFSRAPLSRRGFDDEEVVEFLAVVADQLVAMEAEIEQVSDENRRLKHAMREWHRQQVGYDSAELMARTQQEIEEQIARAESYSREREEEAARRYEAIVAEAYQRAEEAVAARARHTGEEPPADHGDGNGAAHRHPDQPLVDEPAVNPAAHLQVDGLLRALDGLAAHIDAARSLFAQEAGQMQGDSGDHPHGVDAGQGSLFSMGAENGRRPDTAPTHPESAAGGFDAPYSRVRPGPDGQPELAHEEPVAPEGSVGAPGPDAGGTGDNPWSQGEEPGPPEVEQHEGFEVRRQPMPRPPARPAPFNPAVPPPESGPDAPGGPTA